MEKEQNKNIPEGADWLDDMLGTSPAARELGADELAVQAAGLTHPDELELESILAEDWDSVPDLQGEKMPLPLSIEESPMEENVFDGVSEMESLDVPTEYSSDTPPSDEEPSAEEVLPEEEIVSEEPAMEEATEEDSISDAPIIAEEVILEEVVAEAEPASEPGEPDTSENPETHALSPDENTSALAEGSVEGMTAEEILAEILAENKAQEEVPAEEATMLFTPVAPKETPADTTEAEAPKTEEKPVPEKVKERKVRPKFKKGYGLFGIPHVVSTVIWLMTIVVIGLTVGNILWVCITDLMAFGKPDRSITITITQEDVTTDAAGKKSVNLDAIAQKLKDAGLIEYPEVFKFFAAKLTDKYLDIDAGTFTLNSKLDYNALINSMIVKEAPREEIDIMIPEGYTCAQIFKLLEEKKVCTVAELEVAAANGDLGNYWFLEGVERGNRYCLEGYMFPDTYRFYLNDDPVNVLKKFLDGFDYRFTDVMREKLDTLNQKTGLNYTIREVVIIASMIEKETADASDSYMISNVIYNRLTDNSRYWYLGIDATIYYALGGNIDPQTGLPKPLTQADLNLNHPYNTYLNRGLPPGPISNPGRNSLDAALTPDQHSYPYYVCYNGRVRMIERYEDDYYDLYFYVYNPHDGVHIFSETENDHNKAINYINNLG